jgi:signal transduction histidine kinase/FixJ family two-component response regulator
VTATVLVIDDNAVDRERIRRLLGATHELIEAATARDGIAMLADSRIDCVLLDYRLPDQDGVEVIDLMRGRPVPILMLTSQGNEHVAVEAMKRGAVDYLVKAQLDRERLTKAVDAAIARRRLESELAAANRALADREAHLRFLLEQLPTLHWTTDRNLTITYVGGAALSRIGRPAELVGRPLDALLDASDDPEPAIAAHRRALAGHGVPYLVALGGRMYQSHVGALRADEEVVGAIGVALDVSETRQLEQQLRHAVKMDALGKLAGGIAHDFNNILTAISSFAGFARESLAEDDPARADIDQVIGAADRAVGLVRQLLAFSRQQGNSPRVLEVDAVARAVLPMLRRLVGEDVRVELDLEPGVWRTRIDPSGLEQVVVNLVVNARDAMPRGGRLLVEVKNAIVEGEIVDSDVRRVPRGDYVVLSVTDDGEGIPREIVDRIFEPFFTTKEVGRGTGLGLSTVFGIVQQAGGSVTVYSEVGHGTTFRVYLPRALESGAPPRPMARSAAPRGTETIVVIEDEEQVRAVTVRALRRQGYEVVDFPDGATALAACAGRDDVALVLTDVVMPGMGGAEVAERFRATHPRARVLFMSGYTERSVRSQRALPEGAPVLEKPVTPDSLARAVRSALDRA